METAEQLLTDYAPILGATDLRRYARSVVDAADPDGPEPIDDQLQQDRRYLKLKQRRDGMWHMQGKLTATVGAQLNANTTLEDKDGTTTAIPDERPHAQRLHYGLDEACGRLLKIKDQPTSGGTPTSLIVTIGWEDLLAKAGLA